MEKVGSHHLHANLISWLIEKKSEEYKEWLLLVYYFIWKKVQMIAAELLSETTDSSTDSQEAF